MSESQYQPSYIMWVLSSIIFYLLHLVSVWILPYNNMFVAKGNWTIYSQSEEGRFWWDWCREERDSEFEIIPASRVVSCGNVIWNTHLNLVFHIYEWIMWDLYALCRRSNLFLMLMAFNFIAFFFFKFLLLQCR